MTLFNGKKSFLALSLAAVLALSASPKVMAIDVVAFVPTFITKVTGNGGTYFKFTQQMSKDISDNPSPVGVLVQTFLFLPFAILDDAANSMTINESELADLNYSAAEIAEYKNDLTKLNNLVTNGQFASRNEAVLALQSLELGTIAKEQLRLK